MRQMTGTICFCPQQSLWPLPGRMRRKRQSSSRKRNNRKSRRQTKTGALPSVSCMTPGRWKSCFPEEARGIPLHSSMPSDAGAIPPNRQSSLLQTPDRTTPLHLCIALGLNRLAVRMVKRSVLPSMLNPFSCMTAQKSRRHPPYLGVPLRPLYEFPPQKKDCRWCTPCSNTAPTRISRGLGASPRSCIRRPQ